MVSKKKLFKSTSTVFFVSFLCSNNSLSAVASNRFSKKVELKRSTIVQFYSLNYILKHVYRNRSFYPMQISKFINKMEQVTGGIAKFQNFFFRERFIVTNGNFDFDQHQFIFRSFHFFDSDQYFFDCFLVVLKVFQTNYSKGIEKEYFPFWMDV